MSKEQIDTIGQGENASFNRVLGQAPGVAFDTYGAIHFREEDPYYRYYINGTLLSGGINGFSQDIDTRFVDSVNLKVGTLTALYPEGNYSIVDIVTKTGDDLKGGEVSMYGGRFGTVHPTVSFGDSKDGTDFYVTSSFVQNDVGLENPTPQSTAIHAGELLQHGAVPAVPYNFSKARIYGIQLSADYTRNNFSAYGNFAAANSRATGIPSSQFEFDVNELVAINHTWVHLDQSQYFTASAGISYTWRDTTVHADAIYGDGIRQGFVNTGKLGPNYPVNLGIEHRFKLNNNRNVIAVRFDVTNVFDQIFILNDGTGIGEGAVKYGNRRGFFEVCLTNSEFFRPWVVWAAGQPV